MSLPIGHNIIIAWDATSNDPLSVEVIQFGAVSEHKPVERERHLLDLIPHALVGIDLFSAHQKNQNSFKPFVSTRFPKCLSSPDKLREGCVCHS